MTITKGWRKREQMARAKHEHSKVDESIREQRARVLAEAKAAQTQVVEAYHDEPIVEGEDAADQGAPAPEATGDEAKVEGEKTEATVEPKHAHKAKGKKPTIKDVAAAGDPDAIVEED